MTWSLTATLLACSLFPSPAVVLQDPCWHWARSLLLIHRNPLRILSRKGSCCWHRLQVYQTPKGRWFFLFLKEDHILAECAVDVLRWCQVFSKWMGKLQFLCPVRCVCSVFSVDYNRALGKKIKHTRAVKPCLCQGLFSQKFIVPAFLSLSLALRLDIMECSPTFLWGTKVFGTQGPDILAPLLKKYMFSNSYWSLYI